MIIGDKKNEKNLVTLVPSIKNHMSEWQIITIVLRQTSTYTKDDVMKMLLELYRDKEGVLYPMSDQKITMLIRLGIVHNYSILKQDVERKIPDFSCRVTVQKMTAAGLQSIQLDFSEKKNELGISKDLSMYAEREKRKNNVLLLVDDDMFIRKVMKKTIGFYGEVYEVDRGSLVLSNYLKHNPDVVFLDIHMPDKSGLELIDEIMALDSDAYIIVFSADSVRENVLEAIEKGAVGFLSKPPVKERLTEYMNRCITIY